MTVIRKLKNWFTGNIIYPETSTQAVYDADGNRLDNTLNSINNNLASFEIGTQTTSGENRTITLENNYTSMVSFIPQCIGGDYGGGFTVDNGISFVAPNQVTFKLRNNLGDVASGTYRISYVFKGIR